MTPAEELRAAARKLREAAAGPLECINPIAEGDLDEWTKYYGKECPDLPEGDGPWIVLMSPKLAEPLAIWLEHQATWAESFAADENAFAIAITINGGES